MTKLLLYTGKDLQDLTMDAWIKEKPVDLHPLCIQWFNNISHCGTDVKMIFHDGYPIGCVNSAPFAYVNAFSKHINVGFFYGAELEDKNNLLEGNGKYMRHIKLKPAGQYDEHAIEIILQLAYLDIKRRLGM